MAIDGIKTRYEVIGEGPPLLMYAPAALDASLDKYRDVRPEEQTEQTAAARLLGFLDGFRGA